MGNWNPELYLKFADERTHPARDLAKRASDALYSLRSGQSEPIVLDIGCGPGNSTGVLRHTWPRGRFTGVDNSQDMIAKARKSDIPADWIMADVAVWNPDHRYDVVFSNAAMQWMPHHDQLISRFWSWLAPGGVLAVQIPANYQSGLHLAMQATASDSTWQPYTAGVGNFLEYHEPDYYYSILDHLSRHIQIWESTYWHVLENHDALIEWYRATGMRPYLNALPDEDARKQFEKQVLDLAKAHYPVQHDGKILYPFRRIFFTALKPHLHSGKEG